MATAPEVRAALGQGDEIPAGALTTASGKKIKLKDYARSQGKKNLLLLFFRTGTCPVCVSQLTEIAEHLNEVTDRNAAVLAISLDDAIIQKSVSEKINRAFPILLDPDAKTVNVFGVFNPEDKLAHPSQFLVGPDGKILYAYVGKSIRDRPALNQLLDMLNHYSGRLPKRTQSIDNSATKPSGETGSF